MFVVFFLDTGIVEDALRVEAAEGVEGPERFSIRSDVGKCAVDGDTQLHGCRH